MIICLKACANQAEPSRIQLNISERLPFNIISDCALTCDYFVRRYPDYYLLTLDVSGELPLQCQRCLDVFRHSYQNTTQLAVCQDEAAAEKIMEQYDCIVSNLAEVDLKVIVTDELHLYSPEKHSEDVECMSKIH